MKQLLVEYLPFSASPQLVTEAIKTGSDLFVEGIVQRANAKNQNGRVYPKGVLEREVKKYIEGPITENRSWGELDHPDSSIINLKNTSHKVVKLWWDGDDLYGKIKILSSPSGNILKELFREGNVGISSRGMGSVNQLGEGTVEVQDDFDLVGWDFVSTPSTYGSYMKPTMNEGVIYNNANLSKYFKVNALITEILCERGNFCQCDLK